MIFVEKDYFDEKDYFWRKYMILNKLWFIDMQLRGFLYTDLSKGDQFLLKNDTFWPDFIRVLFRNVLN